MNQKGFINMAVVIIGITVIAGHFILARKQAPVIQSFPSITQAPLVKPSTSVPTLETSNWKLVSSRAGWTIKYPSDWKISSCHACDDPTEPGGNFYPPNFEGGHVVVERRRDKPATTSIADWFTQMKATNTRDAYIIREEHVVLNNLPALRVVYSGPTNPPIPPGKGIQHEVLLIVDQTKTVAIIFFSPSNIHYDDPAIAIQNVKNYPIYQQMLSTFSFSK